ncbi:DUF1572 family protein [Mucisphaera calidilacus]|uniref:DinB superfamily protein n=1 Tax=Mucisphaera calidilacus TaxID=2527982 RepID=A0A518BYL8_9BACT|nr:DUF1572 family protein [Mucisphaera calidilacus]QDU72065.1 DinB superfamily protein [Mucisphaera calidilacus]
MPEPDTHDALGQLVIDAATDMFRSQKRMADRAIEQVTFEQLRWQPDPDTNSAAIIIKHLAGSMRSRWSDFLTSDGEKPWRDRDDEFVDRYKDEKELLRDWEAGWSILFKTMESLTPADLTKTVMIRDEPESVVGVINRQLAHYGYHLGQLVWLCRWQAGDNWSILTVPKGGATTLTDKEDDAGEE